MARQNIKANGHFEGWRRENGRVGVRNHVVILPLDDLSNAACESVANNIKGTGDIMTVAKASRAAKDFLQWASERPRERCDISELWVSAKCGESDTTTGLASCPTVGNMYDKLIPQGIYGVFGETSEITGAEDLAKARAATPEIGEKWYRVWQAYQ